MGSPRVAERRTVDFLPEADELDAIVTLRGNEETWRGCQEVSIGVATSQGNN